MPVKVLVVDDSAFMRRRITEILEEDQDIKVVDVACDGAEAVRKAATLRPQVITMDVEMPGMDGIQAVREIMRLCPTAILMLSALTHAGAKSTLSALEAGAMDFIPKRLDDIHRDREAAKLELRHRVRVLASRSRGVSASVFKPKPAARSRHAAISQDLRTTPPNFCSSRLPPAVQRRCRKFCRDFRPRWDFRFCSCSTCRAILRPALPSV